MSISIRPDELTFSSSAIDNSSRTESSLISGELSTNSRPEIDDATIRKSEERKASSTLLDTSINLSLKENSTESLKVGVDKLIEITERIVNETDPTRKEALESDAQSLYSDLSTAYSNAVSSTPAIAQNSTITAIIESGNGINDSNKTYTTTVRAAPSLSDAGLPSLSYSSPSSTLTQLKDVRNNLRTALASYESSTQELKTIISKRSSLAISENGYYKILSSDTQLNEFKSTTYDILKSIA